jgi:hypothetical protein
MQVIDPVSFTWKIQKDQQDSKCNTNSKSRQRLTKTGRRAWSEARYLGVSMGNEMIVQGDEEALSSLPGGIVACYKRGYVERPYRIECSRFVGIDAIRCRDEFVDKVIELDGIARLDSITETAMCGRHSLEVPLSHARSAKLYCPPEPNARLKYELEIRATPLQDAYTWFKVICRSHAERTLLAEHLADTGMVDVDNDTAPVFALVFVDRTIVKEDPEHPTWCNPWDVLITRQFRPLIDKLVDK